MSDENTPDGAVDAENTGSRSDPVKQALVRQRDELKASLKELKAWKQEREAEDENKRLEQMKAEKQHEKVIEELQKKLANKDKELTTKLEEFQSQWAEREKQDRSEKFQSAVADNFPGANRTVLRALMRELADGGGLDLAPEKPDGKAVDTAVATLKKAFPDVLINRGTSGGSPGVPGLNPENKSPGEMDQSERADYYRNLGKQHSDRMFGRPGE